jgi:hypothetical protein
MIDVLRVCHIYDRYRPGPLRSWQTWACCSEMCRVLPGRAG